MNAVCIETSDFCIVKTSIFVGNIRMSVTVAVESTFLHSNRVLADVPGCFVARFAIRVR